MSSQALTQWLKDQLHQIWTQNHHDKNHQSQVESYKSSTHNICQEQNICVVWILIGVSIGIKTCDLLIEWCKNLVGVVSEA